MKGMEDLPQEAVFDEMIGIHQGFLGSYCELRAKMWEREEDSPEVLEFVNYSNFLYSHKQGAVTSHLLAQYDDRCRGKNMATTSVLLWLFLGTPGLKVSALKHIRAF